MIIILGFSLMILFTIGKCFVIAFYTARNTLENLTNLKKMKNNNLLIYRGGGMFFFSKKIF